VTIDRSADLERRRNAAQLLSTTGAAVAGIGVGALFGEILQPFAVAILVVGLVAHVAGMIGSRRAQRAEGYRRSPLELAFYWLCWALIAILAVYILVQALAAR
jgi:drug/metabolite transporter (DMT)-like permease